MTKRVVLLNAFSLSMLEGSDVTIRFKRISTEEAKGLVSSADEVISFVGHEATAVRLSEILDTDVPVNRGMYKLVSGDVVIIAQVPMSARPVGDIANIGEIIFWLMTRE